MSRTQKGSKGAGFEYWTARPGNKGSVTPSAAAKKRTHKAERQQDMPQLADPAIDPDEWVKANGEAIESWNAYVEKNGLPLEKYRQF